MSFKNLFTNQNLLTILHNVLENSYSKNKVSKVSLNGESYQYNQYSLLIIMDFIIKYKIIVKEDISEEVETPVEAAPEEAPTVETEAPVVEEVVDTVKEEPVETAKDEAKKEEK